MAKIVNVDEILFTKEAAEYLNISVQRLHKLVQDEILIPLKKTASGMLFSLESLDNRRRELEGLNEIPLNHSKKPLDLDTSFMQEVINYYTIQSYYGFSDKKTQSVIEKIEISLKLDQDIRKIASRLSSILDVSVENLLDRHSKTYSSFMNLSDKDIIVKKNSPEYPKLLRITEEAPPYLFMRGNTDLLSTNIVSVVGSRDASREGQKKAYQLATLLGKRGITVASGLARGIDTYALRGAVENKYPCIAVIGTPINRYYPKENHDLQEYISKNGLLISQFPPSASIQRWNFPLRNAVMSGISLATAIVEAGETSGALKQADYALKQNRIVFIPTSAINNDSITWPKRYVKRDGASEFTKIDQLISMLEEHKVIEEKKAVQKPYELQMDIFSLNNDNNRDFVESEKTEVTNHVLKYE